MEILQTIWTALTTQNEVLTSLIILPLFFIEAYVSMSLFTLILNINTTKKQKIIYVLAMSITSIISKYLIPAPYNAFINIIVTIVYIIAIFKINLFKAIIALLFPTMITVILETILSKVYSLIFNFDYLLGMNIPLHRFIGTLSMYLAEYFIYLILRFFKSNIPSFDIFDKKKKTLLALNIVFGILLIATQLYITYFYINILPFFVIILNILSLFTYFSFSIYTIFTVSKLEKTSISLEESQLYNKTLEILQDNTKAFRHDFSNILIGMVGYMDKNDMEGLKKYHNQLLEDIKQVNNLTTLSPKVVNNPGVYNVLASKYHKADNLGIKINLEVFLDLNDLDMKIYEFTRILGILMDNAIEATSECEEKIVNVSIRKNSRKHMQLLVIENTYKNKDIDTEKIYEKGYSTKHGNTGLGLWEVRQILKKNNNLNLFTSKNDKYFSQQLEIYY